MRLMCLLLLLKHAFNLSDEEFCEHLAENVVWKFLSGVGYYETRLHYDTPSRSGVSVRTLA